MKSDLFQKEGRWECYCRYIEKNSFNNFFSMQSTNSGQLAVVAFFYCQEVMAARSHLSVHWMRRKELTQLFFMYLQ